MLSEDSLGRRLVQGRGQVLGRGRRAPLVVDPPDVEPERLGDLGEPLPEVAATGTTTRSPGENRLATADSRPPVPDEVNTRTSPSVSSMAFSPAVSSRRSCP